MSDSYSRLYHRFPAEFPDIWADERLFGSWAKLLLLADASWPIHPTLPRSVRKVAVDALVAAGLLIVDGDGYTLLGLDAERTRRRDAGRTGAAKRWQSDGNATASGTPTPNAMPSTRTRRDEQETRRDAPHSEEVDDGRKDLEAFLLVTRRAPSPKQRRVLDDVLALHDVTGPDWAAKVILSNPTDPIGAVIEADKKWREERIAAAKSEETKPIRRIMPRKRGLSGINAELATYYRELEKNREPQDPAA